MLKDILSNFCQALSEGLDYKMLVGSGGLCPPRHTYQFKPSWPELSANL